MGMTIDKRNGDVCFDSARHVYFSASDESRQWVSVTTLIHRFERPFDSGFWSSYKALERLTPPDEWKTAKRELLAKKRLTPALFASFGVPEDKFKAVKQTVLDEWRQEAKTSAERGTAIHAGLEEGFKSQKTGISLEKYGIGGSFECSSEPAIDIEEGIWPEYLVHYEDGQIRLAGQIDLLVRNGDSFSILDWKGLPLDTKLPTPSGWTDMGSVEPGDEVLDREGRPCKVTGKSDPHWNPCVKIVFHDGYGVTCDTDHRWLVLIHGREEVMTAGTMLEWLRDTPKEKLRIPGGPASPELEVLAVEPVPRVLTQCIETDSPSHTYLCTKRRIVTHNTNKQIKTESYYDRQARKSERLLYPLDDLDSCNYCVYNMQLSTYAWMIKKIHPEWKLDKLNLVHFGHDGGMTVYEMKYLEEQVERMLGWQRKQALLEDRKRRRQRIEY